MQPNSRHTSRSSTPLNQLLDVASANPTSHQSHHLSASTCVELSMAAGAESAPHTAGRPLSCLSTSDSVHGHSRSVGMPLSISISSAHERLNAMLLKPFLIRNPSNTSAGSGYSSLHTTTHSRQSSYSTEILTSYNSPHNTLGHKRNHSNGAASTTSDPSDEGVGASAGDRLSCTSSNSFKKGVSEEVGGGFPVPLKRDKSRLKKTLGDPYGAQQGQQRLEETRVSSDAVIEALLLDASSTDPKMDIL
jgi:hypothetical protein